MYFGRIDCSNNFDFDPLKTCITHNVAYCHAHIYWMRLIFLTLTTYRHSHCLY